MLKNQNFPYTTVRDGHCLPTHEWLRRSGGTQIMEYVVLCACAAQTKLLPFGSDPQNVQARERGGSFGRGCTAPVPGPSCPPQACDGLTVAQAHRNQQRSKRREGLHEPK